MALPFHPLHARVTRDSTADGEHEQLRNMDAVLTSEPEVGESLQLFLENGKLMRTSTVQHVERHGKELVIDTANSRYRLMLDRAA